MLVPGHLATAAVVALAVSRAGDRRAGILAALLATGLGGLTPDLVDKSRMALGGSVYGRTIGHSLLFLGLIAALWALLRWRERSATPSGPDTFGGRSGDPAGGHASSPTSRVSSTAPLVGFWVVGVASHLVADLADDALRGWMGGGMTVSSWFAWPWATPYTHAAYSARAHVPGWPAPITPVEIVVILGAGLWLALRFVRRPGAPAA